MANRLLGCQPSTHILSAVEQIWKTILELMDFTPYFMDI